MPFARYHDGRVGGHRATPPQDLLVAPPPAQVSVKEPAPVVPRWLHRLNPFPVLVDRPRHLEVPSKPARWPRLAGIVLTIAVVALLLLGARLLMAQQTPQPRPPEVTDSAIAWGKVLFHGSANCSSCHGEGAAGTEWGPNLTGALWLHGPGTYESIVQQVLHGVPASRSYSGEAMPIRGWVPMNDADVRAVAAYIWSISHPPQPPPPAKPSQGGSQR